MKVFRICVWIWICVSNMCLNNNSLLIIKTNWKQYNRKEEKMHFLLGKLHYLIYCSMWQLRSGFHRTIYDDSKDIVKVIKVLVQLGASHIPIFVRNEHNDHPTPFHMRHSQNFGRINSFVKPVFKIFILGNLIIEWNEGLVFCIRSIDLRGC